jgi:hypothetical protein
MSQICFSRLGECSDTTSVAHPRQFQGYGAPRHVHQTPARGFDSERMSTNSEPGRMLIETSLTSRSGTAPTAVRQVNFRQAPTPQSDRILDESQGKEEAA